MLLVEQFGMIRNGIANCLDRQINSVREKKGKKIKIQGTGFSELVYFSWIGVNLVEKSSSIPETLGHLPEGKPLNLLRS